MRRYHFHPANAAGLANRPLVSVSGFSKRPVPVLRSRKRKSAQDRKADRISVLIAYHPAAEAERLALLLDPRTHAVAKCKDGLEALNHISKADVEVVVTGVKMPHVDGLELISILRNHDRNVPVIAVGEGREGMDQIFLRSAALFGAFGVLAQPVDAGQLTQMIGLALEGRSGQ